ncbi:hypothetical protein AB6A40_005464 [Gnathostoma spinigerum]|uniref:Protein VAC14 homolog n=1 Tax=Gnathostoma spinigerum TaxID=75299 RepID=A0ABD6EFH7_9BILA
MTDAQYAPLTLAVVRTLTDKLYEKRKAAALDIEKQVRELQQANRSAELEKLLNVLKDFAMNPNGNIRKGGLIGLAAAAIALGKNIPDYTSKLIEPVLSCFNDPDSRVRYYACESLYNIVKICRSSCLIHFGELFDTLWRLSADSDLNVRSGAELLDRLLKDIVIATNTFDINELMVLVRERIYSQNTSNRRFIISWLNAMLTAPEISIVEYLPEVLDGLFQMLSDNQPAVRDVTTTVLGQFMERLQKSATQDEVKLGNMVNVLIVHACDENIAVSRMIAIVWLYHFLLMDSNHMLNYLSSYLIAILPHLDDSHLKARDTNEKLMELFTDDTVVEMDAVIKVLLRHIDHEKRDTRMAVLNWIKHIHAVTPAALFPYMDKIFPILLSMLSDTCDDVLLLDLQLLSDICEEDSAKSIDLKQFGLDSKTVEELSNISPFLVKFAVSLLAMFRNDPSLLNERGALIVRQLCLLLEPSQIYRCLAVLLQTDDNIEFVSQMVAMLNGILLTATELFEMRDKLRRLEDEEGVALFICLYRSWAHQPIALLGLCLLSQNYEHASDLVQYLSHLDITVDVLIEIDRLVQLIESPIFSYVRLDLLQPEYQRPLASVLSALLMLLPQTDAFNTLHKRLQCVSSLTLQRNLPSAKSLHSGIDFKPLLEHFYRITDEKNKAIRKKHRELLASSSKG